MGTTRQAGSPGEAVVACGEVRTTLLVTSRTLAHEETPQVLRLGSGDRVRQYRRPRPRAVSPDVLTGVDCQLPTVTGARVRVVGTLSAHAVLTEGRVLQASARLAAPATGPHERQPWGRYLATPGVALPFGRLDAEDVATGWLTGRPRPGDLALGAAAGRLLAEVARHPLLDRSPPFTSRPTRLRWAAVSAPAGTAPAIQRFTLHEDEEGLRTVRLRVPAGTPWEETERFCEDLALHDWLLTTLVEKIERSLLGSVDGRRALRALSPAVDHLLHAWMPGAGLDPALAGLWEVLEREPGFTRQWQALVQRIRDQMALRAVVFHGDRSTTGNGG